MGKFDGWAERRKRNRPSLTDRAARPAEQPSPLLPPAEPQQLHVQSVPVPAPAPAPVAYQTVLMRAPLQPTLHVLPEKYRAPRVKTCFIVKQGNADPWADMLSKVPEIAPQDLSEGVDAMKLTGTPPDQAAMNKWTPTARRVYGVSDQDSRGTIDGVLSDKYDETIGGIRDSSSQRISRPDDQT